MTIPVIGCDPHLESIATSVIDGLGNELEAVTVTNDSPGWSDVVDLCHRYGVTEVGIEGASSYGRAMAKTLTDAGITVSEVPTRVTAATRRIDGTGKSDPGDARTVGRAQLRGLSHRWIDDPAMERIRVLNDRRERLVATQTADINQLRALLTEVDPARAAALGRVRSSRRLRELTTVDYSGDSYRETVTATIRDIAVDCLDRLDKIRAIGRQLEEAMPAAGRALIDTIEGCGTIVAAQLLAQLAGAARFTTDAKLAAWAGTAPLDASSGRQQRHRLNRGGNRQANRAIHTIIITQLQQRGDAYHYTQRRIQEGKTRNEAIRAAKRYATRRIWKTINQLT